jgi:membrane protease YdiL (CAAX protease family)
MKRTLHYVYSPAPIHEGHFISAYNFADKPTYSELKKPLSKLWLFICALSAIFLVICILASRFFPTASNLLSFGLTFIALLVLGFFFWDGKAENNDGENGILGENFWTAFALSLVVFFGVTFLIAGLTKSMSIITWSIIPTSSLFPTAAETTQSALVPVSMQPTLHISQLSISAADAQKALTLFFNVPGPFAEEMGFRVFMYKAAAPMLGKSKAIIFQAVGFGTLHFFAYQASIVNIITAVIVGLLIGWIYSKYENELAAGTSHFAFNILSVILSLLMGGT